MRTFSWLTLLALLASLLASCSQLNLGNSGGDANTAPDNALKIKIAYSPEKEGWLTQRISAFNSTRSKANNQVIFVEGVNKSSGAARTEIKNGQLQTTIWSPSASSWLEVLKYESGRNDIAVSNKSLVLTPVVISMWRPMAEALGWPDKPIGWKDLLELTQDPQGWGKHGHPEWGRFSWGHTDPEISTTALSTLLAEVYAASGKQRDLTIADVQAETTQQFIRDLGKSIKHYGYNTLVFSDNMQKFGMSYISAFPMEEITLIDFNKNKNPSTPLVAIYPSEGTFWHDNPFIIMSSSSPEERQAAEVFYNFLLSDESQKQAMTYGFRPANPNVPLSDPISLNYGVQPQGVQTILPFPSADVLVAAKNIWSQNRKRADIIIVVDVSGSMSDDNKLEEARAGLETFLARILPEDRVGLVAFASAATVLVPPAPLSENRVALGDAIQSLRAQGKTAIFDGLIAGKAELDKLPPAADERIRAIVLLSDGKDTASTMTFDKLQSEFEESSISIFPVAYGKDADIEELQKIVDFSRTILVKGSSGDIGTIFDNLSRYF